jgi:FkbM family methyltransferase
MKLSIRKIKDSIKKLRDNFESKSIKTKKSIGLSSCWTLDLKNIDKNSIIISGGVGKDISFELDLIELIHCKVFLFDPSPTGKETINKLKKIPENLIFIPKGLGRKSESLNFSFPENPEEGSFTIQRKKIHQTTKFQLTSVTDFCNEKKISEIACLKLDIEGFEYEVLDDVLNNSDLRIHQILVEFHHFFEEIPKSKTKRILRLLYTKGYKKIHRNEMDYSFILKNDFTI